MAKIHLCSEGNVSVVSSSFVNDVFFLTLDVLHAAVWYFTLLFVKKLRDVMRVYDFRCCSVTRFFQCIGVGVDAKGHLLFDG